MVGFDRRFGDQLKFRIALQSNDAAWRSRFPIADAIESGSSAIIRNEDRISAIDQNRRNRRFPQNRRQERQVDGALLTALGQYPSDHGKDHRVARRSAASPKRVKVEFMAAPGHQA